MKHGFTLMELIVVSGLMLMIMTSLMFNAPAFNRQLRTNQAAREIGFSLRDAQNRAVSIVEFTVGFFPGNYGVYFSTQNVVGSNTIPNNEEFVLFTDRNADGVYNDAASCDGTTECVTRFRLTNNLQVTNLTIPASNSAPLSRSELSILFFRPDPRTEVRSAPSTPALLGNGPFVITVRPVGGAVADEKRVNVWLTGQISVQQ